MTPRQPVTFVTEVVSCSFSSSSLCVQTPEMSARVHAAREMSCVPISLSILRHSLYAALSAPHSQECGSFWKPSPRWDSWASTEGWIFIHLTTQPVWRGLGYPEQCHQQQCVSKWTPSCCRFPRFHKLSSQGRSVNVGGTLAYAIHTAPAYFQPSCTKELLGWTLTPASSQPGPPSASFWGLLHSLYTSGRESSWWLVPGDCFSTSRGGCQPSFAALLSPALWNDLQEISCKVKAHKQIEAGYSASRN